MGMLLALACLASSYRPGAGTDINWTIDCVTFVQETRQQVEELPGETGDTLGTIAQKFYNDPTLWRKIYEANRAAIGDNPDAIKVGMQLRIPPKD